MLKHIIHSHEIGRFTAVEVLRRVADMCDRSPETFNQRFTIAELVRLWQVSQLCEWDYYPDQWSAEQVEAALGDGAVPTFDENDDERRFHYPEDG